MWWTLTGWHWDWTADGTDFRKVILLQKTCPDWPQRLLKKKRLSSSRLPSNATHLPIIPLLQFRFLEFDSRNELGKNANTKDIIADPTLFNPIIKPVLIVFGVFSDDWSSTRLGCQTGTMFRRFDRWAPRLTTFPDLCFIIVEKRKDGPW